MTDVKKKKEMDLTTGPLIPKLLLYALPVVAAGVLQLLFNAADVIVVGRFAGGEALAAVGATGSLINLIVSVFNGLSVGVSVNVAHSWGAKNEDSVRRTVHTAMLTSVVLGLVLLVIGVTLSATFLTWMGTPDNVIGLSTLYMQIYFLGIPAMMIYNFGSAILRSIGDTRNPLIFLSIAGVINVVLNLILVVFFHMSVAGVAIATSVSQIVSATMVVIFLMRQKNCCRLILRELRIYPDRLLAIIRVGVPAGLQSSVFGLSNVLIQSSVNSFGSAVMEANTAAGNLEGFVYISMNAFYHATLTFVGQNIGAKKYHRIVRIVFTCILMVTILGLTLSGILLLFHDGFLSIYTSAEDPTEMLTIGFSRMMITTTTYFTCGIMEVFTGALRGLGASMTPMLLSIVGVCGIRIGWIYTVFQMNRTLQTLYIAYPVSWITTIVFLAVAFAVTYHRFLKERA